MQNSEAREARERVMADFKMLASDAEDLLRATAGDLGDKAKEARTRLTAGLERAKSTLADWQTQGMESAQAAAKKVDETVRTHPYESLGVAFGVGLLVGVLLRRR
jgi:ElaB/YqjD/DUF883 family membrane-anchored ribosome-binding protein